MGKLLRDWLQRALARVQKAISPSWEIFRAGNNPIPHFSLSTKASGTFLRARVLITPVIYEIIHV